MCSMTIALSEAWSSSEAAVFFRNVWPMYVHELSAFDTSFYTLDRDGRWLPHIVEDWVLGVTPPRNLRESRSEDDPGQPFQRTHVITRDGLPIGFMCVGTQPFKYMPADVDYELAELFLIHAARGGDAARRAVELGFRSYHGRWHLRAIHDNTRAIRFWRRMLPTIGVRDLQERRDGKDVIWQLENDADQ
jgi:predicted acetyltransferase